MEEKDHHFSTHNIESKKKITIVVDEDDPCLKHEEKVEAVAYPQFRFNPGVDPRYIHINIQDILKINSG